MGRADALLERVPGFAALPPDIRAALAGVARVLTAPPGTRIFGPGDVPTAFLLVTRGTVRVQQTNEQGREIVLYRIAPGEACVLTTSCLLAGEVYNAEAITETEVEGLAVPEAEFERLIATSPAFRRLVFHAFGQRIAALMRRIDDVAFASIDSRLAERLLALAGPGGELERTHQDLARELGSAREVVSRRLAELQRQGLIEAGRGHVRILNRAGLQNLAGAERAS